MKHHSVRQSLSPSVRSHNARNFSLIPVNLTVRGPSGVSLKYVLCFANFFFGKMFSPWFPLPLSTFCCIYSWGKRSEHHTQLGWGSCADLVKNRGANVAGVISSRMAQYCVITSYKRNLPHRVIVIFSTH